MPRLWGVLGSLKSVHFSDTHEQQASFFLVKIYCVPGKQRTPEKTSGDTAQLIECPPGTQEALGFSHKHCINQVCVGVWGCVGCAFSPSSWSPGSFSAKWQA